MTKILRIYTDACMSSDLSEKKGFASFIAYTETTHIMSRVYAIDTDNIYIAEKEAAILAATEIADDEYERVEIYMDNKAAVFAISNMIKDGKAPFDKFAEVKVIKVKGHQEVTNPNKVADMLSAAGRSMYYYDNGLQSRALYRLQYPSRVAESSASTSNSKVQEDK